MMKVEKIVILQSIQRTDKFLISYITKHLTLLLFIGLTWGQSDLSINEKAVLDAKRDSKKWLAYPPLALISAGGLGTATFFIGEDIFDMSDESILFPSIFAGSLGAVGFYYLFDRRNFEVIKTGDDYLYEKLYSEEFKKRKIKNIITSSGVVGVTILIGAWIILSSIDMSGYDACFDPRCD